MIDNTRKQALALLLIVFCAGGLMGFGANHVVAQYRSAVAPATTPTPNMYAAKRSALFADLPRHHGCVVFLGDSLTEYLGQDVQQAESEGQHTAWLDSHCFQDRGIGGDTTVGVLSRLPTIVALRPSMLFLMIGINDLQAAHANLAAIVGRYDTIVDDLREELPKTTLYLESVLPIDKPIAVLPFDQQIQAIAIRMHLTYINLYPSFVDNTGHLARRYTYDGVHLMPQAEQEWITLLRRYGVDFPSV